MRTSEANREVEMRYSEELQSILSRFGLAPPRRTKSCNISLGSRARPTNGTPRGILDDLEVKGYVETVSGEKGKLVRFTDKAIDEGFG